MSKILLFDIINIYYKKEKLKFYFLFLLSIVAGLFEYLGLVLIFNFVLFLTGFEEGNRIIYAFFKDNFNIMEQSKIVLIMGLALALIYIFKNIYLLIFTRYNRATLENLSTKIALKIAKDILFQDYVRTKQIKREEKLNTVYKINNVVWQYLKSCIDLVTNFSIAVILVLFLFIKFTYPALFAVVFLSVLSIFEYFFLKKKSRYQNENYTTVFDGVNNALFKIVDCTKEIKFASCEDYYINELEKNYAKYANLNTGKNFYNVFHIYFTEISVMITFAIILIVLFYTSGFNNNILLASISTICALILRLTPAINKAQSALYMINSNKNTVEELIKFNSKFEADFDYATRKDKIHFEDKIELKNVYFSYEKEKNGLKDINLEIKKGEFIAIIGETGSYKTTLSLIISGLIKPLKGDILIDGKKLINSDFKAWQNNISILSQDYCLLFDNKEKIKDEFIDKLNLKNFNSEENNLSHGQRQRLALANILNSDRKVLILDEITSSQDTLIEDKINDILYEFKGKKTIISIAHRLNILKYSDRVIFMKNNTIKDIGTFKELSIKHDDFKKIVELSSFKP